MGGAYTQYMTRKNISRRIAQLVTNWFLRPGACHPAMIAASLNMGEKKDRLLEKKGNNEGTEREMKQGMARVS